MLNVRKSISIMLLVTIIVSFCVDIDVIHAEKVDYKKVKVEEKNGEQVPPDEYVEIYQEAAEEYGVPWEMLAGIHRVETRFSTIDPMESHVGAEGHMQFMPCTWLGWNHPSCGGKGKGDISDKEKTDPKLIKKYGGEGVDGNGDGKADPWDIEDAIHSTASYMKNNGADKYSKKENVKSALFRYNHSVKYGNDVMGFMEDYGFDFKKGKSSKEFKGSGKSKKKDKKKSKTESKSEVNRHPEGYKYFKTREVGKDGTGVDTKRSILGGDVFLAILNTNNFIIQMGMYAGVILVGLLLLFTSASLVGYLVISNNGASNNTMRGFEKVTGTSLARSRETMFTLVKRWAIVLVIIAVFLTGAYVWVMEFVLTMLERFIDYIIKWD